MWGCRCSCTKRPTLACASQRPSSLQQVGFLFPATKIFEINYPVHACLKPLSSCSFPRPSTCAKVQGEIVTHVAGIPFSDVNLRTHNVHQPPWTQNSSLSEVSSLSLEFTYLDRAAGDPSPIYSCHVAIPSTKGYCGSCVAFRSHEHPRGDHKVHAAYQKCTLGGSHYGRIAAGWVLEALCCVFWKMSAAICASGGVL